MPLLDLQSRQLEHDKAYHKDIFYLSHQDRLKHASLHLAKYAGRISREIRRQNDGQLPGNIVGKTLTDTFIVTLNLAGILDIDLELIVRKMFQLQLARSSILVLSEALVGNSKSFAGLFARDIKDRLVTLLVEFTDLAGTVSKECESLDHMDGLNRLELESVLARLLSLLLVSGSALKINYEETVPARWREIETQKIL